ncbi:NAD(P)/FAD-dependent oxidoreductase [Paucibacter soli]|uniref:NAD(P)/FAD-dependent oxidoreductase n=1 Tax=Paucibacter soli TaxID=3133433 RepID=UPI0030A20CA6
MPKARVDAPLAARSFYAASLPEAPAHAPLQGEASCDIGIVGGGLAGLSAAIELAGQGFSVRLLEAQRLGAGASGRNGGQVIHGLACETAELERQLGDAAARQVFQMTLDAIALIHARCARFAIDCDWCEGWLAVATSAGKARALLQDAERLQARYGHALRPIAQSELPGWIDSARFKAGAYDARSGHLHPLKYAQGLARAAASLGVHLHEGSEVLALTHGVQPQLRTAQGLLRCRQVLLAGNAQLNGLQPALAARLLPLGSYIIASAPLSPALALRLIPCGAAVCDTNALLDYFRFAADGASQRMLYGGRVRYGRASTAQLVACLSARMRRSFPALAGLPIEHAWGGLVDVTLNRAPDFGRLGLHRNVYYLQGFSGHGLALSGLAGQMVAEAMGGDAKRFDVFARLQHRPIPGGRWLRGPALLLGMAWYQLRDALS